MHENDEPSLAGSAGGKGDLSLGQVLKGAREAHHLSLEEIATELRIETPQLRALEENRFQAIGPPVFVKGYLRQYGQRLGLDYGDLLLLYYRLAETQEVVVQPHRSIKLRDERQITLWVIGALALLVLVVFLFVWWLNDSSMRIDSVSLNRSLSSVVEPRTSSERRTERQTVMTAPATSQTIRSARQNASRESNRPVAAVDAAQPTDAAVNAARSTDAAHDRLTGELQSTDAIVDASSGRPTDDTNAEGAERVTSDSAMHIELSFDQESWLEVTDAGGERLFYGLGRAGTQSSLAGAPPLSVLIGNADGVRLRVDGQSYSIPRASRLGNTARLTLDAPD
jgi:cytoskeleton protein RodZ